ncbi:winged helix-turn-helix domain-containing protein [Nocardia sp. NPDC005366]|uniref:GntR family transcriptional regulator n=1 Tax=Nocardia sp. NPDC005366 TaxID=3156878 RepID=UPI0033A134FB
MSAASTPKAPYQQVAASLRAQIETGALAPGEKIPSTRALAERHEVAPMTISKAIRALADEGWIVTVPSLGVFVADSLPATAADLAKQVADLDKRLRAVETKLSES